MPSQLIPPLLMALAVALGIGGPVIGALRRLKARQVISADAPKRHQTKAGTPTMGGLIIIGSGAWGALAIGPHTPEMLAALAVTLTFSAIGLLDDLLIVTRGQNLGLKARQKLALQLALAVAFVWWWNARGGASDDASTAMAAAFHLLLLVGM